VRSHRLITDRGRIPVIMALLLDLADIVGGQGLFTPDA